MKLTPDRDFYAAPKLTSSPAAPGILLAGEVASEPSVIEEFDITSGSPVLEAKTQINATDSCAFLHDFAITPNGRDVVTACGWPYFAASYSLNGLTEDGNYQTGPYTNQVAIAGGGQIAVGLDPSNGVNLDVFSPGNPTPTASLSLGGSSTNEIVGGLAWGSNCHELLAATYNFSSSAVILYTISFATH